MTLNTLNPIKFAVLISYLSATEGNCTSEDRMTTIYNLVCACLPEQDEPRYDQTISHDDFHGFLAALRDNRKIDAIKLHRTLTGYGLKESKDVVESLCQKIADHYN